MKIKELLINLEFTEEEFWAAVDALPDLIDGVDLKKNIRSYFKKDGTPKVKLLKLQQSNFQEWHKTQVVIRKHVRKNIHVGKLKKRREKHLQEIKDQKIARQNRIIESQKPDHQQIYRALIEEYNRLIRAGDPDPELKEQIYDQIKSIEEAIRDNTGTS